MSIDVTAVPAEERERLLACRPEIDLGDGHVASWLAWTPDRTLNPQYADLEDLVPSGVTVRHLTRGGVPCASAIWFRPPPLHEARLGLGDTWELESLDPLTVSPSLLCGACGDHGFVREGRWVRA